MKIMYAEMINDKLHYFGEDYEFTLTDEKYHNYATLIIKPQHIKFIKNPNKITKTQAIEEWFAVENEITRKQNNAKRRKKNHET
jgi:hypothetical protein